MKTELHERTVPGLHDHLLPLAMQVVPPPARGLDLGAGSGAWAQRLAENGYSVQALERNTTDFAVNVPVVRGDLNDEFASMFAERFDLITAIEVIEHLENPSCFLRECRMLLADGGKLIITTPNFESAAGRLRFLVTGELRQFGRDTRFNDPTHIAPVHSFVFERIVRHAGLRVVERSSYDARVTSRATTRFAAAVLRPIMKDVKAGDNHVFVLETG